MFRREAARENEIARDAVGALDAPAFARVLRRALHEEDFFPVLVAGASLIVIGTIAYALGEGWHVVDALYFAVATLTTTSVADPELVLERTAMKVFTVFYLLIGIGVLVEILRRLGMAYVGVRAAERHRRQHGSDS